MFHGIMVAFLLSGISAPAPTGRGDETIVRLVGQRGTISVVSTASGPRYSASDAGGVVICANLTLVELRKTHPELSRQIESANCDDKNLYTPLAGLD
jgi:hypothetical protein